MEECLGPTFNQWMAVFLQIVLSDPKKFFELKRQVLRCLTVVFRDFTNYSKDSIGIILRPAWKLMNFHLPIFTEVVCYSAKLSTLDQILKSSLVIRENSEASSDNQQDEEENSDSTADEKQGYESEGEEIDEGPRGVRGMTLQLIELLTTLVQRPNVQEVVRQGMNPLLMTVSSYMLVESCEELGYLFDTNFFLHDKTHSSFKVRTIRNQCIELFSSLIEIFGDNAVESILLVIESLVDSSH